MTDQPLNSSPPASEPDEMLPPVPTQSDNQASAADDAQVVPAGQTMPDSHALVPMPEEAADTDLIEKEWVIKAKQIVEHTADDPFKQAEELGKVKAEYLKKRYNKEMGTA